jgi:hypothetical protein
MQDIGIEVRTISRCAMGSSLVRFATCIDKDAAINVSPINVGTAFLDLLHKIMELFADLLS